MSISPPSIPLEYTGSEDNDTPDSTTGYPSYWTPPSLPPAALQLRPKSAAFEAEQEVLKTQYYAHHTIVGRAMHTGTQRYSREEIFMECMRSDPLALTGPLKAKAALGQEAAAAAAKEKEKARVGKEK